MSSLVQAFGPVYGSNQTVTPAAASANVLLASPGSSQLRLLNTGANICYVRTYRAADGVSAATTADYPIPASTGSVITKPAAHDSISHISATGTTLQFMAGEGT